MLQEQQEQVQLLSDYFQLSGEDASAEWVCFRISYRDINWNLLMTPVRIFSHQMLVIHFLSFGNLQAFYCVAQLAQQTSNVHSQQ